MRTGSSIHTPFIGVRNNERRSSGLGANHEILGCLHPGLALAAGTFSGSDMPTREEMSRKIRADLDARGLAPDDAHFAFVLQALEDMNQGVADLDDELADMAARLAWLANAPTWVNRREPGEFDAFVVARLSECETARAALRTRWERHRVEAAQPPP